MPKSRRDKKISLTRTTKKGLPGKQLLVENIRKSLDQYERIFVFSGGHIKTDLLRHMRMDWSHSKFFIGKNKVMAIALGRTPEEEPLPNLHKISEKLAGQVGILLTNVSKEKVLEYFEEHKYPVTPHTGDIARETVVLPAGLLQQFTSSQEPYLRKLGMPVRLERGIPELLVDFIVCVAGQPLTSNQASILKLLRREMSYFQLKMEWCWHSKDGSLEYVRVDDEEDMVYEGVEYEGVDYEGVDNEDNVDDEDSMDDEVGI